MKRFLVTYLNKDGKKNIFVVEAKSFHIAEKEAYIIGIEKGIIRVEKMRILYNPIYDEKSSWFFKQIEIPERAMVKYLQEDREKPDMKLIIQ